VRFQGKAAFITGGGSGIGRATALAFAREGAAVTVFDINADAAASVASEISADGGRVLPYGGDIADDQAVSAAVEKTIADFGRIDCLFNNAGTEQISPLLETSNDMWDAVLDTNLRGTFLVSRAVLAHMVRTGGGAIVNNASDAGIRGIRVNAAYSTSKAGIVQLTRSIALDYANQNVRANCICPGCIATPLCERFNADVGARHGKTGEAVLKEFVDANIPMLRVGQPEEVASVVLFLSSDEARYVTGAVLPIDGGLTAGIG
jgi:NAD(P)-dependent dehydrogenase (short-subunit alcohol dehydrogenase family)